MVSLTHITHNLFANFIHYSLYNSFGPSGSMEVRDLLCFLPQNAINEKIFVFLYFWFIAMFILGLFMLIKRALSIGIKFCHMFQSRPYMHKGDRFNQNESTEIMEPSASDFFETINDFGYCFILYLLEKNLSPILFRDLAVDLMKSSEMEEAFKAYTKVQEMQQPERQKQRVKQSEETSKAVRKEFQPKNFQHLEVHYVSEPKIVYHEPYEKIQELQDGQQSEVSRKDLQLMLKETHV